MELVVVSRKSQIECESSGNESDKNLEPFDLASGSTNTSIAEPAPGRRSKELRASTLDEDPKEKAERHRKLGKVFLLLFVCMFVARTDQGIIPALNTTLKQKFQFTSVQLGKLGSVVYIGAVTGKYSRRAS